MGEMETASRQRDPIDKSTSMALADYRWLPHCRHKAFQALLEQEEGIARVYFIAEVDLAVCCPANADVSDCSRIHLRRQGKLWWSEPPCGLNAGSGLRCDGSREQQQQKEGEELWPLATTRAVVLVTWTALYICDTDANVLRYVSIVDVHTVGIIRDAWHWLGVSHPDGDDGADVLFRLVHENESPSASQRVFLNVFSATMVHAATLAAAAASLSSASSTSRRVSSRRDLRAEGSHLVRVYNDFSIVQLPSCKLSPMMCHPPALPLLQYTAIWTEVLNPNTLVEHMLLRHQVACNGPLPIRHEVLTGLNMSCSGNTTVEGQQHCPSAACTSCIAGATPGEAASPRCCSSHGSLISSLPKTPWPPGLPKAGTPASNIAASSRSASGGSCDRGRHGIKTVTRGRRQALFNTHVSRSPSAAVEVPSPAHGEAFGNSIRAAASASPSPRHPVAVPSAATCEVPLPGQFVVLPRHFAQRLDHKEGAAITARDMDDAPRRARLSAVSWEPFIERVLLFPHKGSREVSDPRYAQGIAHDLLVPFEDPMRPSPCGDERETRGVVTGGDGRSANTARPCFEPSSAFIPCPPFRM